MSTLAGAYGGADAGRGLRRILDHCGPLGLLVLAAVGGVGTLVCAAGFVLSIVQAIPVAALVFGLVMTGAAQAASGAVLRLWWRRRRKAHDTPVAAVSPGGAPATAYVRSRASLITPFLTAMLLTTTTLGSTWAAARQGVWWAVALIALTAAYCLSTLAPFLLGKVKAGGLYLTPTGVEHRWALSLSTIPWDRSSFAKSDTVITAAGTPRRTLGWFIPLDRVDRDGRDRIAIPATYLGPTPSQLMATLDACSRDPSLRRLLGTPEWLDLSRPPGITRL